MLHIRCTALKWVLAAIVIVFAMDGVARAQQELPTPDVTVDTPAATDEATTVQTSTLIEEGEGGRLDFGTQVGGQDIRYVLEQLSVWGRKQGYKNIVPSQNVSGTVDLRLEDVTWAQALEAVLKSRDLVPIEEDNFIYVYTREEADKFRPFESRVFRLTYLRAEDAETLIKGSLSPKGSITITPALEAGITPSQEETGGKSHASDEVLIVYDYKTNLDNVEKLLQELDIRPKQVLVEATILSATLTEENALGVNIDAITGAQFGQFVDADGNATTTDLANGLTVPATNINNLNRRQARFSVPMSANQALEGSPLTIGMVWNDISVFIRALESITDTTVLANPKLLIVNNQRGEVLIGRKEGYLTTTITTTAAAQEVEYLETGTRLIVRPFIAEDGWVRMEIHPEVSEGGVEQVGDSGTALPQASTTEATSNVMVRDGRTLVIGGLFRERDVANRAQVPVLGNIPILGLPFRSTADTKLREEVIILITPHIIRVPIDEQVSDQLRNDIERTRIGARRGMMWLNRNQFANWHYQQALSDLACGKESEAMWNVDMSLAYEPKMMQAIDLKEQLSDKAYWADMPRFVSSRNIIRRMIMQDLGMPKDSVVYPTRPLDADRIPARPREALGIEDAVKAPLLGPSRLSQPVLRTDTPQPEILPPPEPSPNPIDQPIIIEEQSSATVEIDDEPMLAPVPPGHTSETAPTPLEPLDQPASMVEPADSADSNQGAVGDPAPTPTIDRLLQMDNASSEQASSPAPAAQPKATEVPAADHKQAEDSTPAAEPQQQAAPAGPAPFEVTQRTTSRRLGDAQAVRPLKVWVPKSRTQHNAEAAGRDVPSLWDAMEDQPSK